MITTILICALTYIAIGYIVYGLLKAFGMLSRIEGSSMMPTLCDGDYVLQLPVFQKTKIERYDCICLNAPTTAEQFAGKMLTKRIIGLPGETVQIKSGRIYINNELLEDDIKTIITNPGKAKCPITLGQDEYFVLGDNRNSSHDSRYFGAVKRDLICYRVEHRVCHFFARGR